MSRDNINSPRSENDKNLDYMDYLKMIKLGVTKKAKTIGLLKDNNVYILNNMKDNLSEKVLDDEILMMRTLPTGFCWQLNYKKRINKSKG